MANRFHLLFLVSLTALSAWAHPDREQSLNIYVYNRVWVPTAVLARAEQSSSRIFHLSDLQANWVNCSTAGNPGTNCTGLPETGDVIVQIVPETRNLKEDVFGAAFLGEDGSGQYTDVYYNKLVELRSDWGIPLELALAHVMAHEIGHLLLGLNSHSTTGIMRGLWESGELRAIERGRLFFSAQQSRVMRERLAAMSSKTMAASALESAGMAGRSGTP